MDILAPNTAPDAVTRRAEALDTIAAEKGQRRWRSKPDDPDGLLHANHVETQSTDYRLSSCRAPELLDDAPDVVVDRIL